MRLPDGFSNEANGTAHSPEHGPDQGQACGPARCGITTAPSESRSESAAHHDVRGTSTTTPHTTKYVGPSVAEHTRIVIKTGLAESMSPYTTLSPFTTPTDGRCLDCRVGDGQVSCLECFANTAPALDKDTKSTTTTLTIPSETTVTSRYTTTPSNDPAPPSDTDPSTTTATVTSPATTTTTSTSATTITPSTETVTKTRPSTETVTASHTEPTWTTIVTSPTTTTTTTTTTTLTTIAASNESVPLPDNTSQPSGLAYAGIGAAATVGILGILFLVVLAVKKWSRSRDQPVGTIQVVPVQGHGQGGDGFYDKAA